MSKVAISESQLASLRQLCLDLVAQRAAAGDWAATVAEENKTLAQLCGQVVLRDQPFLFENGYNTLQALSFRWDSARGNMCLFTNELVARAVGASLPELNQALCDFFGHENVTHDVDPEAMDSDLQTLWTSVFEQSSLSSVYAAPTRSQLADSEFFVVFKINTWSKNSPHSLEVHHKSKSILVRDGHDRDAAVKVEIKLGALFEVHAGDKKNETEKPDTAAATIVYREQGQSDWTHKTYLFASITKRENFLSAVKFMRESAGANSRFSDDMPSAKPKSEFQKRRSLTVSGATKTRNSSMSFSDAQHNRSQSNPSIPAPAEQPVNVHEPEAVPEAPPRAAEVCPAPTADVPAPVDAAPKPAKSIPPPPPPSRASRSASVGAAPSTPFISPRPLQPPVQPTIAETEEEDSDTVDQVEAPPTPVHKAPPPPPTKRAEKQNEQPVDHGDEAGIPTAAPNQAPPPPASKRSEQSAAGPAETVAETEVNSPAPVPAPAPASSKVPPPPPAKRPDNVASKAPASSEQPTMPRRPSSPTPPTLSSNLPPPPTEHRTAAGPPSVPRAAQPAAEPASVVEPGSSADHSMSDPVSAKSSEARRMAADLMKAAMQKGTKVTTPGNDDTEPTSASAPTAPSARPASSVPTPAADEFASHPVAHARNRSTQDAPAPAPFVPPRPAAQSFGSALASFGARGRRPSIADHSGADQSAAPVAPQASTAPSRVNAPSPSPSASQQAPALTSPTSAVPAPGRPATTAAPAAPKPFFPFPTKKSPAETESAAPSVAPAAVPAAAKPVFPTTRPPGTAPAPPGTTSQVPLPNAQAPSSGTAPLPSLANILASRNRPAAASPSAAVPAPTVAKPGPPLPGAGKPMAPPPALPGAGKPMAPPPMLPGANRAAPPPPPGAVPRPSLPAAPAAAGAAAGSGNVLAQIMAARAASAKPASTAAAQVSNMSISGLLANLKSATQTATKVAGLQGLATAAAAAKAEKAAAAALQAAAAQREAEEKRKREWRPTVPAGIESVMIASQLIDAVADCGAEMSDMWSSNSARVALFGVVEQDPGADEEGYDHGDPVAQRDALRALPQVLAKRIFQCLSLEGARFMPTASSQAQRYAVVSAERSRLIRDAVAAHIHACACDHVTRLCGPAARARIAPLMRPFADLRPEQRSAFMSDLSLVFSIASVHRLELRECSVDESESAGFEPAAQHKQTSFDFDDEDEFGRDDRTAEYDSDKENEADRQTMSSILDEDDSDEEYDSRPAAAVKFAPAPVNTASSAPSAPAAQTVAPPAPAVPAPRASITVPMMPPVMPPVAALPAAPPISVALHAPLPPPPPPAPKPVVASAAPVSAPVSAPPVPVPTPIRAPAPPPVPVAVPAPVQVPAPLPVPVAAPVQVPAPVQVRSAPPPPPPPARASIVQDKPAILSALPAALGGGAVAASRPQSDAPVLTLAQLTDRAFALPAGVDASRKEQYLADDEFVAVFKVDKEAFGKLAAWKQAAEKKKAGLF